MDTRDMTRLFSDIHAFVRAGPATGDYSTRRAHGCLVLSYDLRLRFREDLVRERLAVPCLSGLQNSTSKERPHGLLVPFPERG
jgi:hypothetical protein